MTLPGAILNDTAAPSVTAADDCYARMAALGIELPVPPPPIGNFVTHTMQGGLIYLSGQGPSTSTGGLHTGKVGKDVSVTQAYAHARLTGINLLAVLHTALGNLNRVKQIVKLFGMVNAVPDFTQHPDVINGCSDLFIKVFGPAVGAHARSAVGLGSLPNNITVEIEAVVAIRD